MPRKAYKPLYLEERAKRINAQNRADALKSKLTYIERLLAKEGERIQQRFHQELNEGTPWRDIREFPVTALEYEMVYAWLSQNARFGSGDDDERRFPTTVAFCGRPLRITDEDIQAAAA